MSVRILSSGIHYAVIARILSSGRSKPLWFRHAIETRKVSMSPGIYVMPSSGRAEFKERQRRRLLPCSFSSPKPKPSGFRYSPSLLRRGLGGGIQYPPIPNPAKRRVSIMKNKPISLDYTDRHELTAEYPPNFCSFAAVWDSTASSCSSKSACTGGRTCSRWNRLRTKPCSTSAAGDIPSRSGGRHRANCTEPRAPDDPAPSAIPPAVSRPP